MNYLKFNYVNWRGEDHEYIIEPDCKTEFSGTTPDEVMAWHLSGYVITRDGEPRGVELQRRSFIITKIRDLEEIPS